MNAVCDWCRRPVDFPPNIHHRGLGLWRCEECAEEHRAADREPECEEPKTDQEALDACLTRIATALKFTSPENALPSLIAEKVEALAKLPALLATIGERWAHFEKHRSTCSVGEEELGETIAEALAVAGGRTDGRRA